MKLKVLETVLKKIISGKATGEDSIHCELYKYGSDKFKTILF